MAIKDENIPFVDLAHGISETVDLHCELIIVSKRQAKRDSYHASKFVDGLCWDIEDAFFIDVLCLEIEKQYK